MIIEVNAKTKNTIAIVLLFLYEFSYGSFGRSLGSTFWSAIIIISVILFMMQIVSDLIKNGLRFDAQVLLFFLMVLIILVNNNYDIKYRGFAIAIKQYVYLFFAFCVLKNEDQWIDCVKRLMVFFSVVYSIATLLCMIFPSLYYNGIYPLLARFNVSVWYGSNSAAGITFENGINAIYIASGFGVEYVEIVYNKRAHSIKNAIILSIIVLALLLTGKRAMFVALIVAMILTYLMVNYRNASWANFKLLIISIAVSLSFIVLTYVIPAFRYVIDRNESERTGRGIGHSRLVLWEYGWELFKNKKWLGNGWSYFSYNNPINPGAGVHNAFLQLLVENGILLSLPFFLFIVLGIRNAIKAIQMMRTVEPIPNDKEQKNVYFAFFFQFYSLILFPLGMYFYMSALFSVYVVTSAMSRYYLDMFRRQSCTRIE